MELSTRMRDGNQASDHVAALAQRWQQLSALRERVDGLATRARVLRRSRIGLAPMPGAGAASERARTLSTRYSESPRSVRNPMPRDLEAPLSQVDEALSDAWKRRAMPGDGPVALATLLARLPQFRGAQARIQALCARLEAHAKRLPDTDDDVDQVETLQQQLRQEIDELEGDGMDGDVQQFLRDSIRGVPLDRLLSQPRVLEFLRKRGLLAALTVHLARGV